MTASAAGGKRVIIVGGNAGGAACAARLRRLDERASISIFELGSTVSYATCGLPYYVGGVIADRQQLQVVAPSWFRDVFNVSVYANHRLEAIDRQKKTVLVRNLSTNELRQEAYDALVLATGSQPAIPPIPGIDSPRVFTLRTLEDADRLRQLLDQGGVSRAAILGGGFIGIEAAENFLRRGLKVCLIERQPQVLPQIDREMATPLHDYLRQKQVDLRLSTELQRIETHDQALILELTDGSRLEVDFLLVATGVRPDTELARQCGLELGSLGGIRVDESMRTNDPAIWAVGDAVEVKHRVTGQPCLPFLAGPTARQGRVAAENICGRNSRYTGCLVTHIVAFFDMTVAATGASEAQLRAAGLPYKKSYTVSPHHAMYYPGAERMTIKLLFHPEDGTVLGAQIVGGQGVDKRIDVLALAIRQKATVYDLDEGEFAYAPQFGSTRDPVNIAGAVAANILRGDTEVAYWEDWQSIPEGLRPPVVDVRNPKEREQLAVPGTLAIPLPELRKRLGEIPQADEVWVHCAVGQRGYYAARILKQHGFRVKNISGGITAYRMLPKEQ
ncbi:MAG: FAD-dependent oxidoreductase [Thermoguttaceae bacterium]|nr:FAD-dependent oxidoreductase [Thermoguttaceae bacterium]MDW8079834.1 FAD-dependent oxidoreductase [Thermoguttaceae bacterium]